MWSFRVTPPGSLIWFTDGSKRGGEVGCGVFGLTPEYKMHTNLGNHASIFQAEIFGIIECAEIIKTGNYAKKDIYIYVDSQAALKALCSDVIHSKLVMDCLNRLNDLGRLNHVVLRWVPGHSGIMGNEKADELARIGAIVPQLGPEPFCGISRHQAYVVLNETMFQEARKVWAKTPLLEHAKALIGGYSQKFTAELYKLSRTDVGAIARALTGHCKLNRHLYNIRLSETDVCRFCGEDRETPKHILCHCGPLIHKRSNYLGKHLMNPEDIRSLPARNIIKFLEAVGIRRVL